MKIQLKLKAPDFTILNERQEQEFELEVRTNTISFCDLKSPSAIITLSNQQETQIPTREIEG
jgi:hypothetical protein